MPMLEKTLTPPHPVVFIHDPTHKVEIPRDVSVAIATSTPSCVAVWTLAYVDGETTIQLGTEIEKPVGDIVFTGPLETPGRKVEVSDSHTNTIFGMNVANAVTQLTIRTSHPKWPDIVQIQVA